MPADCRAASSASRVFPIPPGPVSVSRRTSLRPRSPDTAASSSWRPTSGVGEAGRLPSAGLGAGASSAGSCVRISCSSRRSSAPGSIPSSSSRARASRCASSASACRPERYRALTSEPASRSRSGWVATRRSRAARARRRGRAGARARSALDRCEPLLLQAGCLDGAKGGSPRSASASPRQRSSASPSDATAAAGCSVRARSTRLLEARDVQLVRVEVEGVAGGVRHDPPCPERLAEPVHADLQRVRRCLGRPLAPESVDESGP